MLEARKKEEGGHMNMTSIEVVTIHPVYNHAFTVSEHPGGQLPHIGDALGCDCVIARIAKKKRTL